MRLPRKQMEAEDFQMAPMIDMVFLLLVFFMCVSTLAQADRGIELDLPESAESKVPEDLSHRRIVSVQQGERLFLGAQSVSIQELKQRLAADLRETPDIRVQVRADSLVKFSEIEPVLKACAEAGVVDVIYSTHQMK